MKAKKIGITDLPDVLTVKELPLILPIGLNSAYNLVREKKIKSVKVGSKILIPRQSVLEFLSNTI